MPNKPRPENPARPIRIHDDLWAQVRDIATEDQASPSEVVRQAIRHYIAHRETA